MTTPWAEYFSQKSLELLHRAIRLALDEDGEDLTSIGVFTPDVPMKARITAKEKTMVAGLPVIPEIFREMNAPFSEELLVQEGSTVPAMTEIVHLEADATVLLRAERVILNFISHLSGIANLTSRYVRELEGTGVRLLDTRKTTPGLRWPEKYAVQLAGASNHRRNLEEMLMLKDNHIDQAGSITLAVNRLREFWDRCPPIEVECRTLDDVREAVACRVDRIMIICAHPCSAKPWLSCPLTLKPRSAAVSAWKTYAAWLSPGQDIRTSFPWAGLPIPQYPPTSA